jgi:hypothetical protein
MAAATSSWSCQAPLLARRRCRASQPHGRLAPWIEHHHTDNRVTTGHPRAPARPHPTRGRDSQAAQRGHDQRRDRDQARPVHEDCRPPRLGRPDQGGRELAGRSRRRGSATRPGVIGRLGCQRGSLSSGRRSVAALHDRWSRHTRCRRAPMPHSSSDAGRKDRSRTRSAIGSSCRSEPSRGFCRPTRLLDDSPRTDVWPDSVQVIGGQLFIRLPTGWSGVARYRSAARRSP